MKTELAQQSADSSGETRDIGRLVESLVLRGDVSGLSPDEKTRHYLRLCERLRLDPSTQPFQLLKLNGKEVFYAAKGATDQLRARWRIDCDLIDGPKVVDTGAGKVICATARARLGRRTDTSTGAVPVPAGGGEALCNALLKAETKAKRRVTLSILGLGMLDEIELETIPASAKTHAEQPLAPKQIRSSDLVGDEPVPASVLESLAEIGCAEGAVTVEQAAAIYSDHLDCLKTEELAAAAVYLKRRAGVSMAAWSRAVEEANALRGKALTPPREREPGEDDDQPAPRAPEHPALVAFREKIDSASTLEAVAQAWVCHSEAFKDTPMAPAAWSDAVAAAGTALKESDKAKASEALRLEVKRLKTPPTDPTPNGSEPRRTRKAKADGQAVAQTVQQTPPPEASLSSSEKAQLQNWRNHLARKESVFAVQGSYRKHRHELAGVSKLLGALAFEAACARYVMILRPDNARPDTLAHLEARARSFIATGTEDIYAAPANYAPRAA